MEKDTTVIRFLERLELMNNFSLLEVVDYWKADLCAIGVKKGNHLVYVSTFNNLKSGSTKYDFDLEVLNDNENDKMEVIKQGRGVSESELMGEIRAFLNV